MKNLRNFGDWSINESNSNFYEWVKPPTNITPAQKKAMESKFIYYSFSAGNSSDSNFPYTQIDWNFLKTKLTQNSIGFKYGNSSPIVPLQWIYWGEKIIYSDQRPLLSRNPRKEEVLAYYPLAYNAAPLDKFWVVAVWQNTDGKLYLREMTLKDFLTKTTKSIISDYMVAPKKEINVVDSFINSLKSAYKIEESPRGSNKGPTVNPILKNVNVNPGDPWCAAFTYDVLSKTSFDPATKAKIPDKASVKMHWDSTKGKKIPISTALSNPAIIKPGSVFFYLTDVNKGKGHTGIVLSVSGNTWTGMEGNTNPLNGAREGYGSFLSSRNIKDGKMQGDPNAKSNTMLGFVDYFAEYRNKEFDSYMEKKCRALISDLMPKTTEEIKYLKANPKVLDTYTSNYNNRHNA